MTNRIESIPEIAPTSVTDWDVSRADLPLIPELGIDSSTYGGYVNQGFYRELSPDSETMGSDGFTHCSGLVISEQGGRKITIAHMEPQHSEWSTARLDKQAASLIDSLSPDIPKDIVLIQGDASSSQSYLEDAFASGNFGINSLRRVKVASGRDYPWGFVYYRTNAQLKVFTRENPGTMSTFSLLSETVRLQ